MISFKSQNGSLAAVAACLALTLLPMGASAQTEPIKVGWLVALTGPNSSPGIGFDRGIKYAADEINKAGGMKGRKIEVITRDTQGDPTKAVNAALELINKEKVEFTIGPTNSGEGLATTPVIARSKIPSLVYGVVDTLIDPQKYPYAFRVLPSNQQWTEAVHNYALNILKKKKVGIIGDATGYGTATTNLSDTCPQGDGRDGGPQGAGRGEPDRPDGGDEEGPGGRRRGAGDLDRFGGPQFASDERTRRHRLERAVRRPSRDGVRSRQATAVQARELERRVHHRLPIHELRRRLQVAVSHREVPRRSQQDGAHRRHHLVVGRGGLRRDPADPSRRGAERFDQARRREEGLGVHQGLPGHLRQLHVYRGEPQRLSGQWRVDEPAPTHSSRVRTRWHRATPSKRVSKADQPCSRQFWWRAWPRAPSTP